LKVSLRFFTVLREIAGKREQTLEFLDNKPVTVHRVLEALRQEYGERFIEYVYESRTGEIKGFLQFLVNGRSVSTLSGLDSALADGDVLAIVPPVGGG
jgi:molybdopterin synthase sulfur carrier subunit